jgi:hypothetical protein
MDPVSAIVISLTAMGALWWFLNRRIHPYEVKIETPYGNKPVVCCIGTSESAVRQKAVDIYIRARYKRQVMPPRETKEKIRDDFVTYGAAKKSWTDWVLQRQITYEN